VNLSVPRRNVALCAAKTPAGKPAAGKAAAGDKPAPKPKPKPKALPALLTEDVIPGLLKEFETKGVENPTVVFEVRHRELV